MEKIKKSQHKLILNQILSNPKNIKIRLKFGGNTEIDGTVFDIEEDEVILN